MPPGYRVPAWYQHDSTPHWARVAYRNGQGYARWLFKRGGLKSFPAMTWLIGVKPRTTNWFQRFRTNRNYYKRWFGWMDPKEDDVDLEDLNPHYITNFVKGYWRRLTSGENALGATGRFFQTRFSGFTSQGEHEMNTRSKMWRLDDHQYAMSISQAKSILDISIHNFYPRVVDRNFSRMFLANQIANGGSWYIIARIYCAKRVLDREMQQLGIRDPPHLRPHDENKPKQQYQEYTMQSDDPVFNQRVAKEAYDDAQLKPRRSTVSSRKSKVDPTHGSRYGFSSTSPHTQDV